jgi:hypothetical protein
MYYTQGTPLSTPERWSEEKGRTLQKSYDIIGKPSCTIPESTGNGKEGGPARYRPSFSLVLVTRIASAIFAESSCL